MRLTRYLVFIALIITLLNGMSAVANAEESEEKNNPRILCLVEKCGEAKLTATGGAASLETLGGLTITGEKSEVKIEGCAELPSKKDVNSCKDVDLLITGVKKGEALCSTEGLSAEKGEVLALLDLTGAAEETASKVLEPLLLGKVLNAKLEPKLLVKCGVAKVEAKGTIGCLGLPGLTNIPTTQEGEVTCQVNKTTHDRLTGTCTVPAAECEKLKTEPFEAKLGANFEDAWIEATVKGKPSKDIFVDD